MESNMDEERKDGRDLVKPRPAAGARRPKQLDDPLSRVAEGEDIGWPDAAPGDILAVAGDAAMVVHGMLKSTWHSSDGMLWARMQLPSGDEAKTNSSLTPTPKRICLHGMEADAWMLMHLPKKPVPPKPEPKPEPPKPVPPKPAPKATEPKGSPKASRDPAVQAQIEAMLRQGLFIEAIAARLHVSARTIAKVRDRLGLPRHGHGGRPCHSAAPAAHPAERPAPRPAPGLPEPPRNPRDMAAPAAGPAPDPPKPDGLRQAFHLVEVSVQRVCEAQTIVGLALGRLEDDGDPVHDMLSLAWRLLGESRGTAAKAGVQILCEREAR